MNNSVEINNITITCTYCEQIFMGFQPTAWLVQNKNFPISQPCPHCNEINNIGIWNKENK